MAYSIYSLNLLHLLQDRSIVLFRIHKMSKKDSEKYIKIIYGMLAYR